MAGLASPQVWPATNLRGGIVLVALCVQDAGLLLEGVGCGTQRGQCPPRQDGGGGDVAPRGRDVS
ncbi:MAG: hypothetical protein ACREX8_08765 [Gammaproteobacteria bacterium]